MARRLASPFAHAATAHAAHAAHAACAARAAHAASAATPSLPATVPSSLAERRPGQAAPPRAQLPPPRSPDVPTAPSALDPASAAPPSASPFAFALTTKHTLRCRQALGAAPACATPQMPARGPLPDYYHCSPGVVCFFAPGAPLRSRPPPTQAFVRAPCCCCFSPLLCKKHCLVRCPDTLCSGPHTLSLLLLIDTPAAAVLAPQLHLAPALPVYSIR